MDELYLPGDLVRTWGQGPQWPSLFFPRCESERKAAPKRRCDYGHPRGWATSHWAGCRLDKAQRLRTSLVRAKHAKPAFAKRAFARRAAVSAVATSASSLAFLDATHVGYR